MTNTWMVRAGEGGFLIEEFLKKNMVSLGWKDLGDLSKFPDYPALKKAVRENYPDYKDGKVNIVTSQLYRFSQEIQKGDNVVTYNPETREYWLGEIVSEYAFNDASKGHLSERKVKWKGPVSRDVLSITTKNSLGAISSLFLIPEDAAKELLNPSSEIIREVEASTELETIKEDFEEKALEFLKDKLLKLTWDEMQEFMAGLLRSMGFKTFVSAPGSDRGKDIVASRDGLGLESRTIVEVKHRKGQMGAPEVRSFIGALRQGDKGIYLSTGGFTKEARYEAERSQIPITLVDTDMMVKLIVQYYESFDSDTRALIPLKRIYWPDSI